MAKYLLLEHYRGGLAPVNDVPMDQWTPEEISAHIQYIQDFADRLGRTAEFVDGQGQSLEAAEPVELDEGAQQVGARRGRGGSR